MTALIFIFLPFGLVFFILMYLCYDFLLLFVCIFCPVSVTGHLAFDAAR
jgi:hypothetical protein